MCGQVKGVPLDRTGQPVKEPHSVIRNDEFSLQFTNMITVCN